METITEIGRDGDRTFLLASNIDLPAGAVDDVAVVVVTSEQFSSMLAHATLQELDTEMPWLGFFFVHVLFRRRGVGERLLVFILDYVRKKGKRGVRLSVNNENVAAALLYAKHGFVLDEPAQPGYTVMVKSFD